MPALDDLCATAQTAAETRLDELDAAELDGDEDALPADWCGCRTCEVRETLTVAWPVLLGGLADWLTTEGYPDAAAGLRSLTAG